MDIANAAKNAGLRLNKIDMKEEFKFPLREGAYVINIGRERRSGVQGTHWTALMIKRGVPVYFDSFGMPPPEKIHQGLVHQFGGFYYNNKMIQNISSSRCGEYATDFLVFMKGKKNPVKGAEEYAAFYKEDGRENEKLIQHRFNEYFHNFS